MLRCRSVLVALVLVVSIPQSFADQVGIVCPSARKKDNIFNSSKLFAGSTIAIENGDAENPKILSIYRRTRRGCTRNVFARYSVEGSAPTVESIFFYDIKGRPNIVSIVSWDINNRGEGTFGKLYQVYAYKINEEGDLVENLLVTDDGRMTGMDGYDEGNLTEFPYKTAGDVRKYLSKLQ